MANEKRPDYPASAFCFRVSVNIKSGGKVESYFRSVSGMRSEHEVLDVRAGGVNHKTHKLIGAMKWSNIVLKRGFTGSDEFIKWRDEWVSGTARNRATITIEQLAADMRSVVKQWTVSEAWPVKWEISEFDAAKSELTIETLELAHEGIA
jgi:phage tail-like protein